MEVSSNQESKNEESEDEWQAEFGGYKDVKEVYFENDTNRWRINWELNYILL